MQKQSLLVKEGEESQFGTIVLRIFMYCDFEPSNILNGGLAVLLEKY